MKANSWIISLAYFFIYLLVTFIFWIFNAALVFRLFAIFLSLETQIQSWQPIIIGTIYVYIGMTFAVIAGAYGVTRIFKKFEQSQIAFRATIFLIIMESLSLVRDILIRDIDGVPLQRDYIGSIASSVISIVAFYILSLIFLQYFKKRIR